MRPGPLLAALAALSLLAGSCSARIEARVGPADRASLRLSASLPPALAAKIRSLSGLGASAPLFDLASLRGELQSRKGLTVDSLAAAGPDAFTATVRVADLGAALSAEDLGSFVSYAKEGGVWRLGIRLAKGKGSYEALLPGIDPAVVEAFSPPALAAPGEEADFTKAEYRRALAEILGARVMPALDEAAIEISLSVEGAILSQSGGRIEGQTWRARIPFLDLLVLEAPLEYSLSWR